MKTHHSAIYRGTVRHRRYGAQPNDFTYDVFMVYLDLQELDGVFQQSRWWSMERFNLAQYRRKDYFDGNTDMPLYDAVADMVEQHSGQRPQGPIRMLTNLRYFGFIINPITCYYCFDESGDQLRTVVAEVTNTPWRQRCHYVLNVEDHAGNKGSKHRFRFAKAMHVSPFQPMPLEYHWVGKIPAEELLLHIDVKKDQQCLLDATLSMQRQTLSAQTMNKVIWRYPWMTLKVFFAIYWQALKLAIKRAPFYSNPGHTTATNKE